MPNASVKVLGDKLSAATICALARRAGFEGDQAVMITAIAFAESSGRVRAVGDEHLEDAKWGPSIGLTQIRSLNAQRGTGGTRDELANFDPQTNLDAAWKISNHGRNFRPWATYLHSTHKRHLEKAEVGCSTR